MRVATVEHRFYVLSDKQQRRFQLKLIGLYVLLNILLGSVFTFLGVPFVTLFVLSVSLSVLAPFIDVPSGIKAGNLIYYSPLLIAEKVKNNSLALHGGSLFDYYFVLDSSQTAQQRKKQVLSGYVAGLIKLIEHYEQQQHKNITIKATSYIINPKTAQKVGFNQVQTDGLQTLLLYFNWVNISCSMSIIKGRLSFADISKVYSYQGKLEELIARKAYLKALQARL